MATLTTVKGVNLTNKEAEPSVKIASSQEYGKLRIMYDSYVIDSADEFGTSGLIRLMTIPKGARLLECEISMPVSASTGIFDVGWAASAELDSTGTTVEAADPNGIIEQADCGAAALDRQKMLSTVDGYMKLFAGACELQLDCTEATADSGGDTVEVMIIISVE